MNILLTETASKFLQSQLEDSDVYLLTVKNSGCAGFRYDFKKVKGQSPTHKFRNVPFVLNEKDKDFINDLLIDYKKEGLNNKIVFENPNSEHQCGCGESFSLKR